MARHQGVKVTGPAPSPHVDDRFFRHLVSNLQTGVLAITRDGLLAIMNDIAYRSLGMQPRSNDLGRPFTEVLGDCPEVIGVLDAAFDSDDLPNRAEMRLRNTGKAIGYSLSRIYNDEGAAVGATLFFKDLTQVEQLEERERLRDRLATLGEMAAAIAHEVKNPLASIEVMAGVLRRQFRERDDRLAVDVREQLDDIIKEAKMANAIVVEVLEFVRPIQLQPERAWLPDLLTESGSSNNQNTPMLMRVGVDVSPAPLKDCVRTMPKADSGKARASTRRPYTPTSTTAGSCVKPWTMAGAASTNTSPISPRNATL